MLWVILGIVVLVTLLVPVFFSMDSKYTHKKCKFCRKSIKIESAKCRYCKKYLLDSPANDEA